MTLRKTRAAVASSTDVELAAEELLRKGNAVDAVVAGVFAACALAPSVLLGPVQILLGGGGIGLHALDGRVRQPGLGAPRPRGFLPSEEIPDAARVGVPWLPATLAATLAAAGTATVAQVMGPALALATDTPRGDALKRIAGRGPRALEERPFSIELLAVAGRTSGGLLTAEDLASPAPEFVPAAKVNFAHVVPAAASEAGASQLPRQLVTAPWAHVEDGAPTVPSGRVDVAAVRAVAAVDRNGGFAVACWDETPETLAVDELGLRAPLAAEPVRRGETRVRPGQPRPAAGPMALLTRGATLNPEMAIAAFGARDAYDVLRTAIESLSAGDDRLDARGEARLVALTYREGGASAFRS